jgi:hypothetical protein
MVHARKLVATNFLQPQLNLPLSIVITDDDWDRSNSSCRIRCREVTKWRRLALAWPFERSW